MRKTILDYEITVTETKSDLWQQIAFGSTVRFCAEVSKQDAYSMQHSPIREKEFCIEMKGIPVFVSTHFVRHNVGIRHYVLSQRDDRNGEDNGRWTKTNHTMYVNAEALMNIARKRLCFSSHKETQKIMELIKKQIEEKDYILASFLVPECVYRNGICKEGKFSCGKKDQIMKRYSHYIDLFK